jgi:glycosyltransferase involved in cell wall biosynthesis
MKIAFLEPSGWDYTPLTPLERPLGGSQSALCYLAAQLASNGHEVAFVNHTRNPGKHAGVDCPGYEVGSSAEFLNRFDVVVVLNWACGRDLRRQGISTRLALWTQHAADQPGIAALRGANERATWDAFVMVSEWQAGTYATTFGIARERIVILRNAIAPAFETSERRVLPFFHRGEAPLLVYTSTPFRGLEILLLAFPLIRAKVPGCRLKVYSSMRVYQIPREKDDFEILYELCRAIDGAEYVGSIAQADLAEALGEADILAYPNTYPETSCITVMEAMAGGCLVLTSKLGALPETTAGYGFLLEPTPQILGHAINFARMTIDIVNAARQDATKFEMLVNHQMAFARASYTWSARAREWEQWMARFK